MVTPRTRAELLLVPNDELEDSGVEFSELKGPKATDTITR